MAHNEPAEAVSSVDDFEVGYVADDGVRRRVQLADAWAMRFEAG